MLMFFKKTLKFIRNIGLKQVNKRPVKMLLKPEQRIMRSLVHFLTAFHQFIVNQIYTVKSNFQDTNTSIADYSPLNLWQITTDKIHQKRTKKFITTAFLSFIVTLQLSGLNFLFPIQPAYAAANLQIEPITWDFVGLDSNKPESQGPNTYVVGARVCNTGNEDAINVKTRFVKDGVDNGYTFIRLQSAETYTFPLIPKDDGSAGTTSALNYVFDTPANGSLSKTKYKINYTPKNCQDFYYNFETTRSSSAWQTYQKYYIEASADNASIVRTPRPRQIYIEQLISQSRNYVYSFTCKGISGALNVDVGEVFSCTAKAHTSTAYPQLSFTSDIPNVIFQMLDVKTSYSNPGGAVNSTVYADACGWVQNPTDPRYHTSSGQCTGETGGNGDIYKDQYPFGSTNGGVGNEIETTYRLKVLAFPSSKGLSSNTIQVSNIILDNSGGSYHYNADYGSGLNVINITVNQPSPTDLSVTKSHTGNFSYGANSYTLTVNNTGAIAKAPVTLTDVLPVGYTFTSFTGTDSSKWTCGVSGQTITCTYDPNKDNVPDDFPVGSNSLTLNVNVDKNTALTTSTNFVKVALNSNQTDTNTSNNIASDPTTILAKPNLVLTKTSSPATFPVGTNTATYTLTMSNTSALNVAGPLTLVDTLPPGVTFNSASGTNNGTAWSCSATDVTKQKVICTNTRGLNSDGTTNESTVITITADVSLAVQDMDAATTGLQVINTATVTGGSIESNTADNTSSVTNLVNKPAPDLVVSKTDNGLDFVANTTTNKYYVTVTNKATDQNGNATVATTGTITVTDTLPSPLTYVSATNAPGATGWTCSATGSAITCTNPNTLASGQSTSIEITVGVPSSATAQTVTNNVSVSTTGEIITTNNTGSDTTNIITAPKGNQADIAVVKTVTTAPTGPNTTISYKLALTNPDTNNHIINAGLFQDIVPAQITNVTASCAVTTLGNSGGNPGLSANSCCTLSTTTDSVTGGTKVTCASSSFVSLQKSGGEVDITITGTATKSGSIYNAASVTIDPSANLGEKNIANNYSGILTTVPGPALTLSKTPVTGSIFKVGEIITYRLTVTNPGSPNTINSSGLLTITDPIPTQYQYLSGSSASGNSGWGCNISGTTVTCLNSTTTLTPGQSTAVDLFLKVVSTGTSIQNTATLTRPDNTTTTASNSQTIAASNPDLKVTKTANSLKVGQQGSFTIDVQNISASDRAVAPIIVRDTLNSAFTFLSGTGTGWSCVTQTTPTVDPQTVICTNYNNIAANGSAPTLTLNVLVNNAPSTVSNTVQVNLAPDATITGETVFGNNTFTLANIAISQSSDLAVVKTAVGSFVNTETGIYQIKVTNNGPSNYTGSIVIDDAFTTNNVTYNSATTDIGTVSCTSTGTPPTMSCTLTGGLLAGQSATINLKVNVIGASGAINNTAQINSSTLTAASDPTGDTNDSDPESVTIQANTSALVLSKDDGDDETPDEPTTASLQGKFVKGSQGKYTLIVTNNGPAAAKAPVVITENPSLPTGLTYAGYSLTSNWQCTGTIGSTTFSCTYGNWNSTFTSFTQADLPAGTTSGVEVLVNVSSGATLSTFGGSAYTGLITNTAKVTSSNNTTGATGSEQTAIVEPADLAVTKSTGTLSAGGTGTYTITVTNNGTGTSQADLYVVDYLPTGLTYTGIATANGWTLVNYNTGANEVTFKRTTSLAANQSSNFSFNVAVSASTPGTVKNLVRVSGSTPEPDYNPSTAQYDNPNSAACDRDFATQPVNNCYALTSTVSGGTTTELSVIKAHITDNTADPVNFGTNFTYNFSVTNNSNTAAQDVVLSDTLPDSLQLVSVGTPSPLSSTTPFGTFNRSCGQGTVTQGGTVTTTNTFTCNLLTVPAGATITVTATAKPILGGAGTTIISNTATVISSTADSNAANNSESEPIQVNNTPGTGINIISGKVFNDANDSGPTSIDAGETGTANITVRLYKDNGSVIGAVDASDTLIGTTTTDSAGDYSFSLQIAGNFVINVDTSTLPSGGQLTKTSSPTTVQVAVLSSTSGGADINNNFGYKLSVVAPTKDFGDAPDTYGTDATAGNSSGDSVGASHTVNSNIYLGANVPDAESNAPATLNGTGDDVTGTDDEDGVTTLPSITTASTSYTVSLQATNNTGSTANLIGWIDFNQDGKFQSTEAASATVATGTTNGTASLTWNSITPTVGTTYARFRITTDSSMTTSTPGGAANNGEVEDYQLTVSSTAAAPNLLLVKRITAVKRNGVAITPAGSDALNKFKNDSGTTVDDNSLWPSPSDTYLSGAINGGTVQPGDELDYTIYFLSAGASDAKNVRICDLVPPNTTFLPTGFNLDNSIPKDTGGSTGVDMGMALAWDAASLPTAPTFRLTNIGDGDRGQFFSAGATPDVTCSGSNTNGAVVVKVTTGATTVPKATASGTPTNSYGFVRFRVKVN